MNHPLDGVRQKLIRAEEHLITIESLIEPCLSEYNISPEPDPHVIGRSHFTFTFPEPPLRLSVIVGECLHNLRSALDHVVWQLVLRNGKTPVKENMFPICDTQAGFARQLKRDRLRGVSVQAETLIQRLQPYNAGKQRAHDHALWFLSEMMNIDKHRALALSATLGRPQGTTLQTTGGEIIETVTTDSILRDGAKIVIDRPDRPASEEVSVEFNTMLHVTFQDAPVRDIEVSPVMKFLCQYIKDTVIPSFEPFFD